MIGGGSFAQKSFSEVSLKRVVLIQVFIRQGRQLVLIEQWGLSRFDNFLLLFEDEIVNPWDRTRYGVQRLQQLRECFVGRVVEYVIDIPATDHRLILILRKISAPDVDYSGIQLPDP